MAQVVFQSVATSARGYQSGDPVDVLEDGAELGREVDPATNPDTVFQVVDLPGVSVARVKLYLQEQELGPPVVDPGYIRQRDAGGFFDEVREAGQQPLLRKRVHRLNVDGMTVQQRSNWNTRGQRVGQMTEDEFEKLILDKRTGRKINRATVRRG